MSAAPPAHRQALRKNTGGVTAGSARRPNSRAAPQGRRPLPSRGEGVWAVRLAAVKTLSSRARRAGEPWRRCATTSRHKHGNRGSAERGPAHPHAGAHPAGPDQPAILKVPSPGSPPHLPPPPPLAVAHRRGVCLASEHGGSHLPADTSDQLSRSPRGPYDGDGFYGRSFRPACRARSGTRHPAASPTPARCQRPAPHPPPTSSLQGRPAPCTRPWRGPWGEAIRTGDWWGFPQHSETLRGARCSTSSLREPQEVAPAGP